MTIFFLGVGIGFFLCAPLGPVGILCMRRAILYGRMAGFFSVLGGSFTDLLYCIIAGFGISVLSNFIQREKLLFQIIGSIILLMIGFLFFRKKSFRQTAPNAIKNNFEAFTSTFLLTIIHPVPILAFTAAFATLQIAGWRESPVSSGIFTTGAFVGSAVWAPIVLLIAKRIPFPKNKMGFRLANQVTGALLSACGVLLAMWTLFEH